MYSSYSPELLRPLTGKLGREGRTGMVRHQADSASALGVINIKPLNVSAPIATLCPIDSPLGSWPLAAPLDT